MRIIGDVHQKYKQYRKVARGAEYSIQIGDMGFHYSLHINKDNHKFFGGNHDNYRIYDLSPHQIGHWGTYTHGGVKFFFIRGAFSIDKGMRIKDVSWWEEEQLNRGDALQAFDAYVVAKPDLVLTHSCPQVIAQQIGKPHVLRMFGYDPSTFSTATQTLLQNCFEAHQPTKWVFGHMHRNWTMDLNGTNFQCLNELEYLDVG